MRTRLITLSWFVVCVLLLSACASQPDPVSDDAAGFFTGLLHGVIAPFTLVIHIFVDNVRMYQFPNGGGWYDFGFWLGVAVNGSGAGNARRARSARSRRY